MPDRKQLRLALKEKLYRRRFIVPNAVTVGNMFCGFLAAIYAAGGRFDKAAIAIGFAILLDGLDGRVARRLNATSKFGVEFDSFSDLVSFGVAPALVMYHWCFKPLADEFGVLVCFVFAICAASRLARFNISAENLKGFTGLPSPGAAGMVAACVNFAPTVTPSSQLTAFGTFLMLSLGFLMVSRIEFFSVKLIRVKAFGLFTRILLGGAIALLWYNSKLGFLIVTSVYCLSGPLGALRRKFSKKAVLSPELQTPTVSSETSLEEDAVSRIGHETRH